MADRYPTPATPDRPEFEIRIDGEPLDVSVARDVVELDVDAGVNRHAVCQVLLQNWDGDSRSLRHTDDGLFTPGSVFEVLLGYHSELRSVFTGLITGLTSRFSARTVPHLVLQARSYSVLLAHPERSRVAADVTDGDIFDLIAADYDLTADVEPGATHETLLIRHGSDWDWVLHRAESFGWVAYTRGTTLVAKPPADPTGDELELQVGLNLTELQFDEDVRYLGDPATATSWDADAQEEITADSDSAGLTLERGDRPHHGDVVESLPGRHTRLTSPSEDDSSSATARAEGLSRFDALRHISGGGLAVGIPDLRIDTWLSIGGAGSRHSGPHYVSGVRHRLGPGGYTTEFVLGLPRLVRPPQPKLHPSVAIGVVDDLEDPRALGRVKVRFPWMIDAPDPVWARLAVLDAGSEFGTLFVPEVGQEVLVTFAGPGRLQPVVIGSMWNGQAAVPEPVDNDNHVRSIVTRSGHRLRFHDGPEALVELLSAGGSKVLLDDANGFVELTESGGTTVKLSSDGIELTAVAGDIVLSAPSGKVKLDASGMESKTTGPTKLESTATLDVKASATLGLQGALVNIN